MGDSLIHYVYIFSAYELRILSSSWFDDVAVRRIDRNLWDLESVLVTEYSLAAAGTISNLPIICNCWLLASFIFLPSLCGLYQISFHIFSPLLSSLAPPPPHISGNPTATNSPRWGSEEERSRLHCCPRDLQLNYLTGQLSVVLTCDFRRHAYNQRFALWVFHYGPRLLSSGWQEWNHLTLCSH